MRPHAFLAFCCGLFGIVAQTLLLSECLTTFSAGEIWIVSLLGTWSLAAAAGASVARRLRRTPSRETLCLAFIPVFLLQYLAILLLAGSGRDAGLILPLHEILGRSLLIAGPGGAMAGLLVSALGRPILGRCLWIAVGGVVGGAGTAVMLGVGTSVPTVFLSAALVAYSGAAWSARTGVRKRGWLEAVCLVVVSAALILRADVPISRVVQEWRWHRMAPGGTLEGSFRTAQAEYLYGMDGDRWVVARGGAVQEVLGDRAEAGRIAAIALSQNFAAKRILVIGRGLAVCERFLRTPSVEAVDWIDSDPQYIQELLAHAPEQFRVSDPRLHCLAGGVRAALAERQGAYDVIVINLSRIVEGRLEELTSVEFFESAKKSLRPLGVAVVGIVGDRDASDGEPGHQGACVESTLETVFAQTILVPDGTRTFFVSAAEACLQVFPVILQTRFGLVENAGEIFPVESLEQVYRPDLSVKRVESYDAVNIPKERLTSHDGRPSHRLSGLLQAASRSGVSLDKRVQAFSRGGLLLVIIPILLLAAVRLAYVVRTAPRAKTAQSLAPGAALQSDVRFVSGCSTGVSLAGLIVLTQAWLANRQVVPVHVGYVLSLYAFGLASGAVCARWAVSSLRSLGVSHLRPVTWALAAILSLQGGIVLVAGFVVEHSTAWPPLAALVATLGFPCGAVVILAAKVLDGCASEAGSSWIGLVRDVCLGAACGCLASLGLVPLMGFGTSLWVASLGTFTVAALASGVPLWSMRPGVRAIPHRLLTPVGYGLFAMALSLIACSHILAYEERSRATAQATVAIQDWVQGRKLSAKTVPSADSGKGATYHEVREGSQLKGYIFRSEDFSNTVYGYGGPMAVVLFADPAGTLVDFRITRSYETPRYISRIRSWMESLKGGKVFGPAPMQGVNAVSGATKSCDAILRLLRNSGSRFDASVLAGEQVADSAEVDWLQKVDWLIVYWAGGIVLALIAIHLGSLWGRIAVLVFTAGVGGIWLNRQYSTDHVVRLLSGQGLLGSPLANACLLLGIPLVVLLLGNLYCGYLCPFGAVQELLGFVLPKRFKARLRLSTMTAARFAKYGVLFSLVVVFFVTGSKRLLDLDPLTLVFSRQFWSEGLLASPGLILAILVLLAAPLVTRVWCRYLCPTGAFLSLFNLAGWLGRFLPTKKFGRCEFGLNGRDHLDCIHCDRCRYNSPLIPTREEAIAKIGGAP